jgi:hypothetical protein
VSDIVVGHLETSQAELVDGPADQLGVEGLLVVFARLDRARRSPDPGRRGGRGVCRSGGTPGTTPREGRGACPMPAGVDD